MFLMTAYFYTPFCKAYAVTIRRFRFILWALYAYTPFLTVSILLVAERKSDTFETSDILAIACNIRGICDAVFILILLYP